MPRVTVQNDRDMYNVPPDTYLADLLAIKEMPPSPAHPDWGASYAWEFQVVSGPCQGKRVTAFTRVVATPSNNLGKLLTDLTGRPPREDDDIDLDQFIGQRWRILVAWNQKRDRTRVTQVLGRADAAPALNAPVTQSSGAVAQEALPRPSGPPPRKPQMFWVDPEKSDITAKEPLDRKALQDWIEQHHIDPTTLEIALDGSDEWKRASSFDFLDTAPF